MCDGLATARGMKKIKMLGNSYMAASGIPMPVLDHAAHAFELEDLEARLKRLEQMQESK